MAKLLCLLLLIAVSSVAAVVRYDGHRVLKIIPRTPLEVRAVNFLQREEEKPGGDIWRYSQGLGCPFIFRVSPGQYPEMTAIITSFGLKYEVMINNVQEAIDNQQLSSLPPQRIGAIDFNYGVYHDFDEINQWIDDIAAEYPSMVKVFTASETYNQIKVRGIRISTQSNATRPGLWYQGGIHAREWISPATVLYITAQLLEQYTKRSDVKTILDGFELFVVPVLNADGYKYTWSDDRMWRKTRTEHFPCRGVDPNRNYAYQWGESGGSSSDPCSETYRGPSAFSEPVIKGVTDYMIGSSVAFKGFIDFHSFSEVWMSPWGYTKDIPGDFGDQDASSAAAVAAIKAVHGTEYRHGTIANVLYVANGNSVDWAYGAQGIKYSATPELRDKGQFGFLLPEDQILPCGEETLEGFLAYADYVLKN